MFFEQDCILLPHTLFFCGQ